MTAATAIAQADGYSLVLATPTGLSFVKVNSLKKLSVQTLDLGNRSVGKLVSINDQKVLGVGTVQRSMDAQTGDVVQSSHFEIRDNATLEGESIISINADG